MKYDPVSDKVRRWELAAKSGEHRGDHRVYEQSELTIDGEMQLFAIANRAVSHLQANNFPFEKLGAIFPTDDADLNVQDLDWGAITEVLASVAEVAPRLISEAAATLLGIHTTDENGNRNPDYLDEVAFLRASIGMADFVEMLETFFAQNDVERLRRPFEKAWMMIRSYGSETAATPSLEASTSSSPADTEAPAKSVAASRGRRSTRT